MASSGAAQTADAAGAAPWHERLHARLAEAERAVAALLSVCEEPAATDALEARAPLRCACHERGMRARRRAPAAITCRCVILRPCWR
jgi:hypothetical protein